MRELLRADIKLHKAFYDHHPLFSKIPLYQYKTQYYVLCDDIEEIAGVYYADYETMINSPVIEIVRVSEKVYEALTLPGLVLVSKLMWTKDSTRYGDFRGYAEMLHAKLMAI
jgi:hypothetical protein